MFGSRTDPISLLLLGRPPSKKPKAPLFQMKGGRIVPQVNMHRLTKLDARFDVSDVIFQDLDMTSFHAEKCCHLMHPHASFAGCSLTRLSTVPDPWYVCSD